MGRSESFQLKQAAVRAALIAAALIGSASAASAQNAQAAFNAICDQSGPLPTICNAGAGTLTAGSAASLAPTQFNSVDFLGSTSGQNELDAASRRLRQRRDEDQQGRLQGTPAQYASADPRLVAAAPANEMVVGPVSLFGVVRGGILDRDDTTTQRGFSGNTIGGRVGGDVRATQDLILGGYLGYDRVSADYNGSTGNTRADNYSVVFYGNYNVTPQLYLETIGGYIRNNYDTVRDTFAQTNGAAVPLSTSGKTHGNQWLATFGAGYEYPIGATTLTPYGRFNYLQTRINDYIETGNSGTEQAVSGTTTTSLTSVLGLRASQAFGMSWGVLVPQIRGEWIHEFDGARSSASSFTAAAGLGVTPLLITDTVVHDYGKIGLSVTAVLPHGLMPYFDYEALVGDQHFSQHIFTAGLRMEF